MSGARGRGRFPLGHGRQGSALVEVLLVVPVLMLILFGLIGVGRVTQARAAVAAVGRECARAAAGSWTPGEAASNGAYRAGEVAAGYGLTNGTLTTRVDLGGFRAGETVACSIGYTVELGDLPLLGWGRVGLASTGQERIAPYRGDRPGPSR